MAALIAHTSAVGTPDLVATSAIDTTGANLIVVGIVSNQGSTPNLIDSKGNTWTPLTQSAVTGASQAILYYSTPTSVGAGHTFTNNGTQTYSTIYVAAFSGAAASSPYDGQQNGATATGVTTLATGSITPTQNGAIVVTVYGFNVTGVPLSINSGFTITDSQDFGASNNYGGGLAYLIQGTAAAVNPVWTRTGNTNQEARIASFLPTSALNAVNPTFKLGVKILDY